MKKAPPVRLSLRKLLIAMLAVGPISILPSPLLATVPQGTTAPFTVSAGAASWNGVGTQGTIGGITDRSVLIWNNGAFQIANGETFTFTLPSGGSVLNKVGYNTSGGLGTADNAVINGTLNSNGRVLILANGNIWVGGGATVNTIGGLVLSTLQETDQFTFTSSGNLALNGASTGSIELGGSGHGGTTGTASISGNLSAYSASIAPSNLTVNGDVILNQGTTGGGALNLAGATGNTTITGNLTVVSGNQNITQTNVVTVSGNTVLTSGTGSVALGLTGGTTTPASGGSGYTIAPSVTISSGGTGTGTTTLKITTAAVTAGGTGYTTAPSVTLSGGGGTGATATATVDTNGAVTGVTITAVGSGYTSAPTVVFGTVTGASGATATTAGAITSVNVVSTGAGFTSTPSVTFGTVAGATAAPAASVAITGANNFANVRATTSSDVTLSDSNDIILGASTIGGSLNVLAAQNIGTNATVTVNGTVNLTTTGTGNIVYANNSTAGTFNATAANGTVTANVIGNVTFGNISAGGAVNSIAVNGGGAGYTAAPTVSITGGGGTGASAHAVIDGTGTVVSIIVDTAGSGYTSSPTISLTGGGTAIAAGSTAATATAVLTTTGIASVTGLLGGNYTAAPSVTFSGGSGTGAAATAVLNSLGAIIGYQVTAAGSGYTSAPTITLTGGTAAAGGASQVGGPSAQLFGTSLGYVTGGTGGNYTAAPTVVVSAPTLSGGTQAVISVALNTSGGISGYTIVNAGTGYISAPTITLSGGTFGTAVVAGTAGNFTATLTPTSIATATATAGTNYVVAPSVTITGGGGAGALITATVTTSNTVASPLTVVSGGSGFTAAPTLSISGGGTAATVLSAAVPNIGNNVSLTSSGNATLSGAIYGNAISVTANSITAPGGSTNNITTGGAVTLNATGGNMTLPAINAGTINATSVGSITQAGTSIISTTNGTSSTFNAGTNGSISLTNNNALNNATLSLTGNSVSVNNSKALTLGNSTIAGNLTINTLAAPTTVVPSGTTTATIGTGNVTIGAGGGSISQNVTVGGQLNITTNLATISDDSDVTLRVFGPLTLTTNTSASNGANIVLTSATGSSGRGSATFGQINASAGTANVTVNETQTANFGNVTANVLTTCSTSANILFAGNVNVGSISARASSGSITQNAAITTANGTSTFNSSNSFGTVLDNSSNTFGGQVTVTNGGNNVFVAGSNFTLSSSTSVTGGNLSISTVGATNNRIVIAGGNATNVTANSAGQLAILGGTFRNLTLISGSTAADSIVQTGTFNATTGAYTPNGAGNFTFTSNGTVTLSSAGGITLSSNIGTSSATNNITGPVVLNGVAGTTVLATQRNLTLSGNATGDVIAFAGGVGSFSTPWGITLGNLNVRSLTVNAMNGNLNNSAEGSSGTITQASGTSIHVENMLSAATFNNNIVLGNNGNSAGRVELSSGSGNITYVEDVTAKIGAISTTGSASLSSRFGSVIEDPNANVVINVNGTNSVLTVTANAGSATLGNTTHTTGTTTGNIVAANITAAGAASIQSSGNLVLGNTAANSLSVAATNITQSGGLNVFGLSTFNATNNITLTNNANNFGPLSLTTQGVNQNIAITEGNTLNLRSVSMPGGGNGTFTATSVNGDIVDTGLNGVRLGGTVVSNTPAPGTGVVTLIATNGNITLDDSTTDIVTNSGVVFNAKNVTFAVLGTPNGSNLVLGANGVNSAATGNLIASSALGSVSSAGNFTVAGNALFQAPSGSISIGTTLGTTVGFGTVKFLGNQVTINEAGSMDIVTGSQASGPALLTSGGNINIVDAGGVVTFGNNVSLQATGNIVLKLTQVGGAGTLRLSHTGTADLSQLSKSADLNGKDPVDLGTGPGPATDATLYGPKP